MFSIRCGEKVFIKGARPLIMGIVNITPNSFSDGGKYLTTSKAVKHALELIACGADILDIGGVSTAPNALPVTYEEERRRVMPVIKALALLNIKNICVDTTNAQIAKEALELGASWINDQSAALADPQMPKVMSKACAVVLMHSQGDSGVLAGEQQKYPNLFAQLNKFFAQRVAELQKHGVELEKIIVDPGLGFGKGLDDSLKIVGNMAKFNKAAHWTLLGASRKSFMAKICDIKKPEDRDQATLGANMAAILSGADIIRTHNVKAMVQMLEVFTSCMKFRLLE